MRVMYAGLACVIFLCFTFLWGELSRQAPPPSPMSHSRVLFDAKSVRQRSVPPAPPPVLSEVMCWPCLAYCLAEPPVARLSLMCVRSGGSSRNDEIGVVWDGEEGGLRQKHDSRT